MRGVALPWKAVPDGVLVDIRLTPRGGRDAVDGVEQRADGRAVLRVRVRAAAHDGEANRALCRLMAERTGAPPRQVTIVAGATARVKRLRIAGDPARLLAALAAMTVRESASE